MIIMMKIYFQVYHFKIKYKGNNQTLFYKKMIKIEKFLKNL
jgi:hypothetical protein